MGRGSASTAVTAGRDKGDGAKRKEKKGGDKAGGGKGRKRKQVVWMGDDVEASSKEGNEPNGTHGERERERGRGREGKEGKERERGREAERVREGERNMGNRMWNIPLSSFISQLKEQLELKMHRKRFPPLHLFIFLSFFFPFPLSH